jgi:hypothetical protein
VLFSQLLVDDHLDFRFRLILLNLLCLTINIISAKFQGTYSPKRSLEIGGYDGIELGILEVLADGFRLL